MNTSPDALVRRTSVENDSISVSVDNDPHFKPLFDNLIKTFLTESDLAAKGLLAKSILKDFKEGLSLGLFRDGWEVNKRMV